VNGDWTVVYRFDSVPHLQSWLNSRARQGLLETGTALHDRPATQQVMVGTLPPEELVTVVVSHEVSPELVDEFLGWQPRMTDAERRFEGFEGAELFRPVPGVQDEWTAVYRFDSGENLQRWLDSDERRQLLAEAKQFQN
jgi:antibiotic biosynthesis monooxygenase (ABM) superfamily enzyme